MASDQDIFISYAHLDNRSLAPQQEGWISRFHRAFHTILATRLGREPTIWRDDKLCGNDVFTEEIIDRLSRSELFIAIVTPRYLKSEWCPLEAEKFCLIATEEPGPARANKSRIFKLIKTPIDDDSSLPRLLRQTLGYRFFVSGENNAPLELDPIYGDQYGQGFNRKVAEVAHDVAELLKNPNERANAVDKPAVYVAECAYDRAEDRAQIVSDLKLSGYSVLPDIELPREEEAYQQRVSEMLDQCVLSVHLVGSAYGFVPDGPSGESGVAIQNSLAAKRSAMSGLRRVISLPAGTGTEHPLQSKLLKSLNDDPKEQMCAELITGDIEAVKLAVRIQLSARETAGKRNEMTGDANQWLVYVLCTEKDRLTAVPLLKCLQQAGLEPHLPVFTGDASAVRDAHETMLRECAATIVYYGEGDEAWRFHTETDLRKSIAQRGRPIPVAHLYAAPPITDDKRVLIALGEPHVVDGTSEFCCSALDPFVNAVKGSSHV